MGEGTLKDRREGRGEEGGVEHNGHDQLGRGTTRREGTSQSRCHPARALQVSQRSIFSPSKGLWQTLQCVSSKRPEGGLAVGWGDCGTEGEWDGRNLKWA